MELFDYLMTKKGHNTHRDLFSYLLGKNAGESGTYTTFSGTSLNISNTLQAKIKNIALEGNASQDGTPTPDTPIPIKVVTGEQNIKIHNKNLFNKNSGIDYGKFYTNTGEIGTDTELFIQTLYIPVKSNTPYTISGYYTDYFRICEYDDEKNFIQRSLGDDSTTSFSITTTTLTKYIRISCFRKNLNSLQLEQNSQTTSYISYQSQSYNITLGNIELCKIVDYQDYIYKNNGSWYLHKEIGKVVLDGSETFIYQPNNTRFLYAHNISNLSTSNANKSLCNCFVYGTSNNNFYINNTYFFFYKFEITNVDDFKNLLQQLYNDGNALTIYYPLATPTNTKITDTTLIQQLENINNNARSYKDTTIITCSSASTDNETIGFSGKIKVTSVSLGNSLNTSLLSSNLQEGTNIDDIQEEPNLDEIEEINDEPIENEEPIEEYQEL